MYAKHVLTKSAYMGQQPVRQYGQPYSYSLRAPQAPGARKPYGLGQLLSASLLSGRLNDVYGDQIGDFFKFFGGQQPNAQQG